MNIMLLNEPRFWWVLRPHSLRGGHAHLLSKLTLEIDIIEIRSKFGPKTARYGNRVHKFGNFLHGFDQILFGSSGCYYLSTYWARQKPVLGGFIWQILFLWQPSAGTLAWPPGGQTPNCLGPQIPTEIWPLTGLMVYLNSSIANSSIANSSIANHVFFFRYRGESSSNTS